MEESQEVQNSVFRIIVIDDNQEIHHDFAKILTPVETSHRLQDLKSKVFGDKGGMKIPLPKFQIDSATQGQEGVEKIKKGLREKNPMLSLSWIYVCLQDGMALKPLSIYGK